MPDRVTFTPTQADYVAANRLWLSSAPFRRWSRWLAVAVAALALLNIGMTLALGRSFVAAIDDASFALILLVVLLALPLMNRLLPRQVRRMFVQRPSMSDPIVAEWNEERISFAARSGTSIQPWREVHRALVDDRTFVFLPVDRLMLIVPRRVLTPEQASDLERLAGQAAH